MSLETTYNWNCDLQPSGIRILKKVSQSINRYKPRRVLDVGCGNGYLCRMLVDRGVECVGIEPTSDGTEKAKKLVPEAEFYVYSCYEDPMTSNLGEFDLIVSTEVIEHLYFPNKLLDFAKTHLKKEGVFLLSTPNYGSYWRNLAISVTNRWDYHHLPLWDGGHIKFWSKKTLTSLLTSAGFSVERWEGVSSKMFEMSMICHARLN